MEDWLHCAACGTLFPYDAVTKRVECPYCKVHPELEPMWDTLAVPEKKSGRYNDYTYTVHMPEVSK